ncbi:unnamed protein product [Cuscuta campestris]|uniref:Chromo domain-containing protein n=1 Tax=Cuscuta campestris TaxID=132261 RepID=A0A484LEX0_9ASTE|nr:unnamed protein product [Cuscuta campestris]
MLTSLEKREVSRAWVAAYIIGDEKSVTLLRMGRERSPGLHIGEARWKGEERLRCVTMMLEGPAADWFRWRQNNGLIEDREDFVRKLKLRFDPLHYVDYVGQLARIPQVGGVMEYQAAFEKVLTHVTDVPEPYLQSLFQVGLKNDLQHEISLLRPATLSESFALARELEARHHAIVQSVGMMSSSWGSNSSRSNPNRIAPEGSVGSVTKPGPTGSGSKPNANGWESSTTTPIRRLTRAERMQKDAKGLCYNCDQKWHKGHKCRRFILIMGDDEGEEEEEEPDEEIEVAANISSLNSMVGVTTPRFLRLTGRREQHRLDVLIHGGSTHNFVHPRAVKKLGLSIEPVTAFRVYVGNGDALCCNQQCRGVSLELQGTSFTVDLYVLQIHGHDVVLGVQWLRLLGRVLHDYDKVTMEFTWGEHQVTLHGDTPHTKPTSLLHLRALHARREVYAGVILVTVKEGIETGGGSGNEEEGLPKEMVELLARYKEVFQEPQGLPPHRTADHRIFVQPGVAPVNVRAYRYPHFQKAEIETQPYRQHSVARPKSQKLARRFYRPFRVLARVREAAYKLEQPEGSRVHPVFHVSLLRRYFGSLPAQGQLTLLEEFVHGQPISTPVRVHTERFVLIRGQAVRQWLVEWSDGDRDDTTWEPYDKIQQHFPSLHLEDKVFSQEDGNVTNGLREESGATQRGGTTSSPQSSSSSERPTASPQKKLVDASTCAPSTSAAQVVSVARLLQEQPSYMQKAQVHKLRNLMPDGYQLSYQATWKNIISLHTGTTIGIHYHSIKDLGEFSIHPFKVLFFETYGIMPEQLAPNGHRMLSSFINVCLFLRIPLSLRLFDHMFDVRPGSKETLGFVIVSSHQGRAFLSGLPPSNRGWKDKYVSIKFPSSAFPFAQNAWGKG